MPKRPEKGSNVHVERAFEILKSTYPEFKTELTWKTPFQLTVAVILSAQCTDARVNLTTPALFERFPDAKALSKSNLKVVEKLIFACGFYHNKALAIRAMAARVLEEFDGEIPRTMEELVTLPGVGRKTASVVLNQAFGLPAIAVDTHVKRVSQRLGWAKSQNPEKIEFELKALLPEKDWEAVNGLLIHHGRRICKSRKPDCPNCVVRNECEFFLRNR